MSRFRSTSRPERTPEERERDRREREGRRAQSQLGEPGQAQAPPTGHDLRNGEPGALRDREPGTVRNDEPDTVRNGEPGTVRDREPGTVHNDEPGTVRNSEPGAPRAKVAAVDRDSAARRARELLADRRPVVPGTRSAADGRRRGRGRWLPIALGLGAVVILGGWLAVSTYQPFQGSAGGRERVAIPTGSGVRSIGQQLEKRGVVASSVFFEARATLAGKRGELRPGTYGLRRNMSYAAVIDALSGGPEPELFNVTIPEGRSRGEVAALVAAVVKGSYARVSRQSRSLSPRRYGAPAARDLEGFLFPATYELQRGSSARALVERQLEAFKAQFSKVDLRAAKRRNLTPYDVLIIASLVEREAQLARERPLIASVIYNRLRAGMPLGIDATVRFATNNWTRPLRESELAIKSPYNTRKRAGLPPGPIGNPGIDSIRAAARPAHTSYRYYVVTPGACGEHSFSTTPSGFERDRARYNRQRARRGGRSPTSCPK